MPLTSFLHRKSNLALPLPPLDPPPSVEKRQEKEKAWLASIYDRKGKASSTSSTSKSDNKDARGLGYTAPASATAGRQRNHGRSRTADSVLTTTTSVGKSSASVKSGLLSISSRWRQSSSRPASVMSRSDRVDDTLQRNIATLQVPTSSHTVTHQQTATSSSSASFPSLAQRLEQLSQAHAQGLLDDEEYRVLRGNLFENSLKKPSRSPESTLAVSIQTGQNKLSAAGRDDHVETTGTLLGLPRLVPNQDQRHGLGSGTTPSSNTNLTIPHSSTENQHLLPLPSSSGASTRSTRTRSKLSIRSSKSAISLRSRFSSILPSSKQQNAPQEEVIQPHNVHDEDQKKMVEMTLRRKPSFLDSAKSAMTFKASALAVAVVKDEQQQSGRAVLPTEWTASAGNSPEPSSSPSAPSRRSSHLSVSGISSSAGSSSFRTMFQPIATSTAKAGPSLLQLDETNSSSTEHLRNNLASGDGIPRRSISEDQANHSFFTLSPLHPIDTSSTRDRSSTLLSRTSTQYPSSPTSWSTHDAHLKFSVIQAEDESLDAAGLRKAIAKVELEKQNVSEQFRQLERDLLAKLGRSGHDTIAMSGPRNATPPRRQGASGKQSLGSSSSSMLGDAMFRQSLGMPSSGMVRRPSVATSVQSHQSTSSSLLSPSSSRARPSYPLHEAEDEEVALSLAMSPSSPSSLHKNGRHRLERSGSSDGTEATTEGDDKLARLEEKRRNVEMRYQARLEYLDAKLVARELKEKLRR